MDMQYLHMEPPENLYPSIIMYDGIDLLDRAFRQNKKVFQNLQMVEKFKIKAYGVSNDFAA